MRAIDVQDFLVSLNDGWVNANHTVDTIKTGDPKTLVSGIAVGWTSTRSALEQALSLGCNLFITHEPTWYAHQDDDMSVFRFDFARRKRELVEKNGIVILRCHDLLDRLPGYGIIDSWSKVLDLGEVVESDGYFRLFRLDGMQAGDLARKVAKAVQQEGQQAVELVGSASQRLKRVAIGTGAITPLSHWIDKWQIDGAVCTDDGFSYWRDGSMALDADIPVVVVNHAVSEMQGVRALASLLVRQFGEIPVQYIAESCLFSLIS